MGISSFFFFSKIEHKHLIDEVEKSLAITETQIQSTFLEPETFLITYSEIIRNLLLSGGNADTISAYMETNVASLMKNRQNFTGVIGTHGFFHSLGDKYIVGGNWTLPKDFIPQETEWYKAAVSAKGKVTVTGPYTSIFNLINALTFSQCIFDDNGNPLGVICLDLDFNEIFRDAVNIDFTENSYGLLLNSKLEVIAHPSFHIESGLTDLLPDLEQKFNIYEYRMKNYMYENSVAFFKRIKQGWRLGIIIPLREYYANITRITVFLSIGGILLSVLLCTMLYHINKAKIDSDKKTRQNSNFLATMSHEIRTPLNAILGMTEIQMQNTTHPPSTSEAFIKINNSGNLLLNIINDILDLSKIESGNFELIPIKYEVTSLINDVVQLNQILYEGSPVDFSIEIDENTPAVLVGDELRIKQILNNLLSNAFKYTEQGKVTLTAGAECVTRGGIVLVTLIFQITDTGQGMTPKQVENLFNEYTHFNMEANRTTEGAGLGMTITRNLVELMSGQINIKSAIGKGTTVTVRLPQKTPGIGVSELIGKEMSENLKRFKLGNFIQLKKAQVKHEFMPYGSVIIVDDVETNLYVAKGLMAPYGLKIDLASSGFEVIEKVKSGSVYDIIFMDHMMPKLDGIEATRILREIGYKQPIVALTANALAGQAEVFLKNGFDDFISKPIDIRQLNVTLNKLVRNKQPPEVLEAAQKEKAEFDKKQAVNRETQQVDPQLAVIFSRDAEKAITVLDGVLQKNLKSESDIQLYIINVHAMKSALANIGETELSATALRLEQAGREKDINLMLSETKNFLEGLYTVVEKIKPKDEEDADIEDTQEALAFLREKLIAIKSACDAFDKKSVKNNLNELKEKTWSHKTRELMNSIADHLLHSEFDEVSGLAESYIRTIE
ncbi:MAG: response regulator [Treponema sp.]|jgi:signal transduction histidine kinase/CheY-like chemotaxis protein/HPt (histidine-containing phosphotransfer) domain-containing protein|nr:response regulator [Treponema sp.]